MDRSKVVAIVTGVIAVFLGIIYLAIVLLLDSRGEMIPAPVGLLFHSGLACVRSITHLTVLC